MCQVHTGAYVSFLTPGETVYTACHPRKTTTYILHVVSITTHTHDRRKSIGENKQIKGKKKQRKEKKIKERKEKRRSKNKKKTKRKKKGKKEKDKKSKKRRDKMRKQGREKRRKEEKKKRRKISYSQYCSFCTVYVRNSKFAVKALPIKMEAQARPPKTLRPGDLRRIKSHALGQL